MFLWLWPIAMGDLILGGIVGRMLEHSAGMHPTPESPLNQVDFEIYIPMVCIFVICLVLILKLYRCPVCNRVPSYGVGAGGMAKMDWDPERCPNCGAILR